MKALTRMKNSAGGFTLIEIITVVVILSILAVLGTKFVTEATKSYYSTQTRSRLVNTARQSIERMSRQLRAALPYSVRITNSASCVEFLPIASGGNYVGPVPDVTNLMAATSTISVSPHSLDFGAAQFVSIGAMSPAEIYGVGPASLATLSSRTATSLTLSAPKVWQRNSINQRFYLLDSPQAFCIVGNQLRFYAGQVVTAASINTTSAFSIMADDIDPASSFSIAAGSENRAVKITFNLTFKSATLGSGSESVAFNQSVTIRNVP